MDKITVFANAKLNLSLAVNGVGRDGYHEIDTVMTKVDINDIVTVKKSRSVAVLCRGIDGEDNLAFKAATLFFEKSQINGGAQIIIEKYIPVSAGLGGGSSDAAAALVALNTVYGNPLSEEELLEIALLLGSDVPFFIKGETARATGRGEILTPIENNVKCACIVYKIGEKPSTGKMYAALDREDYKNPDMERVISSLKKGDLKGWLLSAGNAFSVLWEEGEAERFLNENGADKVLLTGSGPSRFAVFSDTEKAKFVFEKFKEYTDECFLI